MEQQTLITHQIILNHRYRKTRLILLPHYHKLNYTFLIISRMQQYVFMTYQGNKLKKSTLQTAVKYKYHYLHLI